MKKILILVITLLIILCMACTKPGARIVEKPYIAATNTSNLDIESVELTDTATLLNCHVNFRPGWWIRIDKDCYIEADGNKYALVSATGIEPGEKFTMPEDGQTDFTLIFEPVPFGASSIDFIEGEDGWLLTGIDISGKERSEDLPDGLPKELAKTPVTDSSAVAVLDVAPATINIHFLDYHPSRENKVGVWIDNMAGNDHHSVILDRDGNATLETILYGSSLLTFRFDGLKSYTAQAYVAPGETTDVYILPDVTADYVKSLRDNDFVPTANYAYTTGRHAGLNNNMRKLQAYSFDKAFNNKITDWRIGTSTYNGIVSATRDSVRSAIDVSDLPDKAKAHLRARADVDAFDAVQSLAYRLSGLYWNEFKTDKGMHDSIAADAITYPADISPAIPYLVEDPADYLLQQQTLPGILYVFKAENQQLPAGLAPYGAFIDAFGKAEKATLTSDDIATLEALDNPFFVKAVLVRQEATEEAMREAAKTITPNPDVPADKLFDAIVAPYRGKVVLVDLWNTWCSPCRAALKANEPLKTGELADDDIVWIYIADESSNYDQYSEMIKDIKGVHHKVSAEQIAAIRDRFEVDGIPFYILVDRQGKAVGHPDFRDHAKLIEGIRAAL